MKNRTIAAAGHLCVDMTPGFPKTKTVQKLSQIFVPGKLINVENANF